MVDGESDSSHTYAANGTYTITATSDDATPGTTQVTIADLAALVFDPAEHTIPEVQAYVADNPDDAADIRDLEAAGKARSTLLTWLDTFEDDGTNP